MSKDIKESVMNQIHLGKVKMKPKVYFIVGSILTFIGLISTVIASTFLIGLVRFSLCLHWGRGAQYKLDQMLLNFPWWITILAIVSLTVGIWLIHKYDFTYKIKPWVLTVGFILAIIVGGWIVDMTGLNDVLYRGDPMKGMMENYLQKNNTFQQNWRK
jgi:uncharacterized membrane protein